jgi:ABC-type dipeptide/oligopeptide/nickel transport system permease subunit
MQAQPTVARDEFIASELALEVEPRGIVHAIRRFSRSTPYGVASAIFLVIVLIVGVAAPMLAPYDPLTGNYAVTRHAPSALNLLGTDDLGRDELSRIIWGTRITLLVSIASVLLGDVVAFGWGISSGFLGGRFDLISQRVIEVLMSFPTLILAMLLLIGLGAGISTVVVAIALTQVPGCTRIVRSSALATRNLAYVDAARSLGASPLRIMLRSIAPQCMAPFLVILTLNLGSAVFAEASLSFLGVGVPPPAPSWGNMLGGVLATAYHPSWWLVVFPGVAITLTVLAANLLGDAMRDFLDPKLRQRIK